MAESSVRLNGSLTPTPLAIASETENASGADSFALGHLPNNGKILDVKKEHSPLTKGSLFEAITNGIGQALNGHLSKIREAVVSEMRHQANWEQFKVKQLEAKFDTITKDLSDRIARITELEKKVAELEQKLAEAEQKSVPKPSEAQNNKVQQAPKLPLPVPPIPPRLQRSQPSEGHEEPPPPEERSVSNPTPLKKQSIRKASGNELIDKFGESPKDWDKKTADQKLDYVLELMTVQSDGKTRYSFPDIAKHLKKQITIFGGGGHGDVFMINDTPHVIKRRLKETELQSYKFLEMVSSNKSGVISQGGSATGNRVQSTKIQASIQERLATIRKRNGMSAFKPATRIVEDGKGRGLVVIRNAQADDNGKMIVGENKKIGPTTHMFDVKIGEQWVFRSEQIANGFYKESDTLKLWAKEKRVESGQHNGGLRGYGLIAKQGVEINGKKVSHDAKSSELNTDKILSKRMNGDGDLEEITPKQLDSIIKQLEATKDEAMALPVAFVGSSIMIAFPDNPNAEPQIRPIDYAHPVFDPDIAPFFGNKNEVDKKDYREIKKNYINGINDLLNRFKSFKTDRELTKHEIF